MLALILSFTLYSAFAYWVVYKGGADYLEGLLAAITISWLAITWNTEQIRFYMFMMWIISLIGFIIKLFYRSKFGL